jgi:phosphate starvation-inducible PhoH-like protein
MQGRTFKNCVVIADEMQNCTPLQMFMLMTRIGENTKMIITGDLKQTKNIDNGLNDIINKLENKYGNDRELMKKDRFDVIRFDENDIQRHKIVSKILELY